SGCPMNSKALATLTTPVVPGAPSHAIFPVFAPAKGRERGSARPGEPGPYRPPEPAAPANRSRKDRARVSAPHRTDPKPSLLPSATPPPRAEDGSPSARQTDHVRSGPAAHRHRPGQPAWDTDQ